MNGIVLFDFIFCAGVDVSFGKFGARPRGVNNPIYWVNKYRQDERRLAAVDRFNERWGRLQDIQDLLIDKFVVVLNGKNTTKSKVDKIQKLVDDVILAKKNIQSDIDSSNGTDLNKYATAIKRLSLLAFDMCKELNVYDDIDSIAYDKEKKCLVLNGEAIWFIG